MGPETSRIRSTKYAGVIQFGIALTAAIGIAVVTSQLEGYPPAVAERVTTVLLFTALAAWGVGRAFVALSGRSLPHSVYSVAVTAVLIVTYAFLPHGAVSRTADGLRPLPTVSYDITDATGASLNVQQFWNHCPHFPITADSTASDYHITIASPSAGKFREVVLRKDTAMLNYAEGQDEDALLTEACGYISKDWDSHTSGKREERR